MDVVFTRNGFLTYPVPLRSRPPGSVRARLDDLVSQSVHHASEGHGRDLAAGRQWLPFFTSGRT
jgi:hypothetical protein